MGDLNIFFQKLKKEPKEPKILIQTLIIYSKFIGMEFVIAKYEM